MHFMSRVSKRLFTSTVQYNVLICISCRESRNGYLILFGVVGSLERSRTGSVPSIRRAWGWGRSRTQHTGTPRRYQIGDMKRGKWTGAHWGGRETPSKPFTKQLRTIWSPLWRMPTFWPSMPSGSQSSPEISSWQDVSGGKRTGTCRATPKLHGWSEGCTPWWCTVFSVFSDILFSFSFIWGHSCPFNILSFILGTDNACMYLYFSLVSSRDIHAHLIFYVSCIFHCKLLICM